MKPEIIASILGTLITAIATIIVASIQKPSEKENKIQPSLIVPQGYKVHTTKRNLWLYVFLFSLIGGVIGYLVGKSITEIAIETPSQGSSFTPIDYISVAELIPGSGCYGKQLPENLDPVGDPQGTIEKVNQSRSDGSYLNWAYAAQVAKDGFVVIYTISNTLPSSGEIIVENTAKAIVEYVPSPEHANTFDGGCGGGEWNFLFTPIFLNDKIGDSATLTTHSEKYDYFSLQLGENERFELPFVCERPGLYKTSLIFRYSFKGKSYEAKTGQTQILCLNDYTQWDIREKDIFKGFEYQFKGSQYEKVP